VETGTTINSNPLHLKAHKLAQTSVVVGAAVAAGMLTAAVHIPVVGGIAALALHVKNVYDNQFGGPVNCAAMSKWAGGLVDMMKQLPPLGEAAQTLLEQVHSQVTEMLVEAERYERQNKLVQWASSAKCHTQQQEAQATLQRLLASLQLGVAGESLHQQLEMMSIVLKVDEKVDQLLATSELLLAGQTELLDQVKARSKADRRASARKRAFSSFAIPYSDVQLRQREVLGRGSSGTVYKARYQGDDVAAKVIDLKGLPIAALGVLMEEAQREVALMTRLHSPRIVRVLGICENPDTNQLIILMSLAQGGSLRKVLDAAGSKPLDVARATRLLHDAATGIEYLHSKDVLHRDIKCDNLLLDDRDRVLVSDFGISKSSANATATVGGAAGGAGIKGSAPWMAPEALEGGATTRAGDVYAFGIVMWEILSRKIPWEGMQVPQIARAVCDKPPPHNRPPLDVVSSKCPKAILELMQECWTHDTTARPSFADIARRLALAQTKPTVLSMLAGKISTTSVSHPSQHVSPGWQRVHRGSSQKAEATAHL
jgi:serine/threonine protein kinase